MGLTPIPPNVKKALGKKNGEIIDTLVIDVIETSKSSGDISFSKEKYKVIKELNNFSITNIYSHPDLLHYQELCKRIIKQLFGYLTSLYTKWDLDTDQYKLSAIPLDKRFGHFLENMKSIYIGGEVSAKEIIKDYIAGMTDSYALRCMRDISIPKELDFEKALNEEE